MKCWSASPLSKLASLLGTLIMADRNTKEKNKVHYTRVWRRSLFWNKCLSLSILGMKRGFCNNPKVSLN